MTALTVLATTAMRDAERAGPNSSPAASVKAVRGKGKTVTTTWAARKASGNHGPTEVAQSRSCTAVGNGTNTRHCDENHNRGRDHHDPAAGDLRRRRDDRGAYRAQRADDGLHVCQEYVVLLVGSVPATARESPARRSCP